ncbi:MAG: hypothetical protein LV479_07970 [Methylacidiphilales bacterium]|nr:hypothetical protein [Candidatus Methylacidiphilales bacterium]
MIRTLAWICVAVGALPVVIAIVGLIIQAKNNPVMHDGRLSIYDKLRIAAIDGGMRLGETPMYLRYGLTVVGIIGVLFLAMFVYYTFYLPIRGE